MRAVSDLKERAGAGFAPAALRRKALVQLAISSYIELRLRPQVRVEDEAVRQVFNERVSRDPEPPPFALVADAIRESLDKGPRSEDREWVAPCVGARTSGAWQPDPDRARSGPELQTEEIHERGEVLAPGSPASVHRCARSPPPPGFRNPRFARPGPWRHRCWRNRRAKEWRKAASAARRRAETALRVP